MTSLDRLRDLLKMGPVMAESHVLLPAALDPAITIEHYALPVAAACDDPAPQPAIPILIQEIDQRWTDRFAVWRDSRPPDPQEINRHLVHRLDYVRASVVSQASAGASLARRFLNGDFDCGILLLVDGLSYFDCSHWPERPGVCFVDGPSITKFGFLQIMQASELATLLIGDGRYRLRAYTYWGHERNELADQVFAGIPIERVRNFPDVLARLHSAKLEQQYVFILREGLDELAHRRRELTRGERQACIQAIHDDMTALMDLVRDRKHRALIALISDHGIVWRENSSFQVITSHETSWHGRYSERPPSAPGLATPLGVGETRAYCLHPGLLCREPRSNETGFHGGLSAEESFVPFVSLEVR